MKFRTLTHKNIAYFTRYYKLVALAVFITVTVIVGSLVVGDSVRTTLVKRVAERLGDTETIIFSRNSFMSEKLLETPLFGETTRGILLTNGFISQRGKLIPVFVWGVDDLSISRGTAKINEVLAKELTANNSDNIVLRLPATGLVPSGSLFVTENYTTSLRLANDGIVSAADGGNISMKNEQLIPFNIFVDRKELAEALEVEGKINLILDEKQISSDDLNKVWDYTSSGLSVEHKDHFTEIISDRVFLQEQVVETISRNNNEPNRLFSYLANSIEIDSASSIPYSFVTAIDKYKGETIRKDEIILSDYSAKRLNAKVGDMISVSYFTSQDLKTLVTDSTFLRVKQIVPISELVADTSLSAEFPGLSDVERCTDWDSDLPINMDLITDEDEKYWNDYRSTPKAIVAYETVASDWGNAYGIATAIRVADVEPELSGLRAEMFGIQLVHPRESGLFAAKNGVDFSGLFLSLGFFIIISAMLLMLIPISEMLRQRQHEIALLKALGYTRKRISRLLWMESAPVVLISSIVGTIGGLLYTSLILWLLGNVWKGATQTDGFSIYPGITTLSIGLTVGILLSLCLLRLTIARALKNRILKDRTSKDKCSKLNASENNSRSFQKKNRLLLVAPISAGILTLVVIGVNFILFQSVTLFVFAGIILIGTAALWGNYLIYHNNSAKTDGFCSSKLVWATLSANRKQSLLSFFALATGVFIVFSVGLNRKGFADSSQIRTGTGGYSLWCESSVPVYHNMATQAGREKLSLTDLPDDTKILQCLRYNADDASCLNLNKVTTPTVLGVEMTILSESDFPIGQNIWSANRNEVFERMQTASNAVYPALIDETVLTWGLMMNLGDTLYYENDKGESTTILLAGILPNTIFQGNILIDRKLFSDIWRETTGSEVFLLKLDESRINDTKNLLSQALNEYGVMVSTTNDRLKQFNTVTDTYLTIFLTLGGLGLLLGIMSFIIVIRKNLTMRHGEIKLYRTLGFTDNKIEETLRHENLIVPLYAIATGVISSLLGVSIRFMNTGIAVWFMALLFTIFFVACVVVFVRKSVRNKVQISKSTDL